jgi:hypothetical protein
VKVVGPKVDDEETDVEDDDVVRETELELDVELVDVVPEVELVELVGVEELELEEVLEVV